MVANSRKEFTLPLTGIRELEIQGKKKKQLAIDFILCSR